MLGSLRALWSCWSSSDNIIVIESCGAVSRSGEPRQRVELRVPRRRCFTYSISVCTIDFKAWAWPDFR